MRRHYHTTGIDRSGGLHYWPTSVAAMTGSPAFGRIHPNWAGLCQWNRLQGYAVVVFLRRFRDQPDPAAFELSALPSLVAGSIFLLELTSVAPL